MKRILLVSIMSLALGAQAQTEKIKPQQDFREWTCYDNNKSCGFREKSIDMDGKVFTLMTEGDFVGENIIVCDKEELLKLCDRISYEYFGVQGKHAGIDERTLLNTLFGNKINTEQAALCYLQEGSFHLICQGLSDQSYNSVNRILINGKEIDAKQVAELILNELEECDIITKYTQRPVVVVIHSSGAGVKSRRSFASKLSKHLAKKSRSIYVVAAPGKIHPSISTWPSYSETVIDENGNIVNWNCFHRGRCISEGEKDFAATIIKIQNEYLK